MKVSFNLTELIIIKHQHCDKCFFDKTLSHPYCALLPRICFVDSQVYTPIENLSDIFTL